MRVWMSSSPDPPCWWLLAQALDKVGHRALAHQIKQQHSKYRIHVKISLRSSQYSCVLNKPHPFFGHKSYRCRSMYTNHMYHFSSGVHVQLQKILLSQEQRDLKPDQQFLEAGEVGSKWPSLASALSLTSSQVEEVKKKHSHFDHALQMLLKWVEREGATYGQLKLCHKLKSIPLFQYGNE